jgi:uncharacterized membrane protein
MSASVATGNSLPPLFARLMSFPAACFILTLVADMIYARSYNMMWESFAVWLLAFGLLAALPFVLIGLFQALGQHLWPSMASRVGYAIALLLSIINVFIHSRDGYTAVVPGGIALSAIVVVVLLAMWIVDVITAPRRRAGI